MAADIRIHDPDADVRDDVAAIKDEWNLSWERLLAAVAVDPPSDEVLLAALRADEAGDVLDEFCAREAADAERDGGDGPFDALDEFGGG